VVGDFHVVYILTEFLCLIKVFVKLTTIFLYVLGAMGKKTDRYLNLLQEMIH
jgi:hypothetical protein